MAWTWPRGMVSSLILGIAVLGILALLFLYPLAQKDENSWVKTVSKAYYIVLIPLIVVLWLAIQVRVGSYGITENRYFLILLASWLSFISLYFNLKKQGNIKIIPISLFVFIMIAAVGPFSAFNVSGRSQTARLGKILTENNMLENGKFSKKAGKIDPKTSDEIHSIVRYLVDYNHIHRIAPWYDGDIDALLATSNPYSLKENFVSMITQGKENDIKQVAKTDYYYFNAAKNIVLFLDGYDYYVNFYNLYKNVGFSYRIEEKDYELKLKDDFSLHIFSEKDTVITFNLKEKLMAEINNSPDNYNRQLNELVFVAENGKSKAKLILSSVNIQQEDDAYFLQNIEGDLLFKLKE